MLVLARKVNQSVMIGDDVKVTVVEVSQGKVKLGITAPNHVAVHREEVWEEIQRENLLAQQASPEALQKLSRALKTGKEHPGAKPPKESGRRP